MKKEEQTLGDKGITGAQASSEGWKVYHDFEECIYSEKSIQDSINKIREKIKKNGNLHTESCDECNKIFRTNRHEDMIFEIINDCLGDKFK